MSADPLPPTSSTQPPDEGKTPPNDLGFELPPPVHVSPARGIAIVLVAGILVASAFVIGYLPKRHAHAALQAQASETEHTLRRVEFVSPRLGGSSRSLALPGSVRPLEETVIYSRANGYLRHWLVDIGDRVHEGQLLAEIETPEIDQELAQARAQLAQAQASVLQAEANRDLARAELDRARQLATTGYASQQELQQRQAGAATSAASVAVAQAAVLAARANIQRLQQLLSFSRVTAPFAGTITARTIDRGALVTAGNATPLFRLAAIDPARVFVQVPQDVAPAVHAGQTAEVTVREYPSRVFHGEVARASGALDPASRTMNTEVRVPNGDGALLSGMYADVALSLPTPHRVFEIPATAVITDAAGVRVAIVGDDNRIRFQRVTIERDTGSVVQISNGLAGTERIVRIGIPDLSEGTLVQPSQATN